MQLVPFFVARRKSNQRDIGGSICIWCLLAVCLWRLAPSMWSEGFVVNSGLHILVAFLHVYASRILTNSHCFVLLLRNTNRSPVASGNFTPPLPFYCCIPPTPDVYNVWFHRVHIMKRERAQYYSCCCEVLVGVSAGAREATTEQCRMDWCRSCV